MSYDLQNTIETDRNLPKSTYNTITGKKATALLQCFNFIILDELNKYGIEAWVAGGSIRAFFESELKSKIDIDVFFPDTDRYVEAIAKFCHLPKLRETKNSTTYKFKGRPIDFVGPPYIFSSPTETIQNFDFTVCAAATDGEKLYVHDMFFEDLKNRHLRVVKLKDNLEDIVVMRRLQKYIHKGYIADDETLQAIIEFVFRPSHSKSK